MVCNKHNLTYMMYSGTLIGSYRHHDMIPWDDDLDIFMNYTERTTITNALSNVENGYMVRSAGSRIKFYSTRGIQTSTYPWKWPYLDISFFKENDTHLWDGSMEDDYGDRFYVFPKPTVFPLHHRPLGPYFFAAPRDSYSNIRNTYASSRLGSCSTSHYSHKTENLTEKTYDLDCEALKNVYPFVHRSPDEHGVRETLMLGDKVMHSFVVDEPRYAVTEAYRIRLI